MSNITKEIKVKDKLLLAYFERCQGCMAGLQALSIALSNANKKAWDLTRRLYPEIGSNPTTVFDHDKKILRYEVKEIA